MLVQKQVQKKFEGFLQEKAKLLNENTLLRAKLSQLEDQLQGKITAGPGGANGQLVGKASGGPGVGVGPNRTDLNGGTSSTTTPQPGEFDPRLQLFVDKLREFTDKMETYEKEKVEAQKEKDMWYEKSIELEKRLTEYEEGNFTALGKKGSKQRRSKISKLA